jgi:hypothetical protein
MKGKEFVRNLLIKLHDKLAVFVVVFLAHNLAGTKNDKPLPPVL